MKTLSSKDLSYFKVKLEEMERELIYEISNRISKYKKEKSSEELENISNSLNDEVLMEEQRKSQKMLKEVQLALIRMQNGVYGICPKTKKTISLKRLIANPTAICNIEAPQKPEKNFTYPRYFNNI
ncbi:TraR/DksA family transcriptional regulator [Candidatus Cytomitobacter indipagum]|uniref:TraR/DksA family transcriptional regulator n=1 Tax=Candidatus Cytomitobacter indipagum TaxID=2601575 RepID=A0A5C0UDW0_9PROT|nr:TraR/DksA family transcriptional regulator [Candidatus Cytomitobacter indipagum]QEK37880.1 TraR/DksA family transcriptional regulator [Candidatus Cytomitobacter indipagum]